MSAGALAAGFTGETAGTGETVTFWVIAVLAVIFALGVVVARRAVYSALCLAATMLLLAVAYLAEGATFLGVVQVVVYTGAVMMLFLFVVMLVGTHEEAGPSGVGGTPIEEPDGAGVHLTGRGLAGGALGIVFGLILIGLIGRATVIGRPHGRDVGAVEGLADLIFVRYVWAFELTAALLITATVGALILAHHERTSPAPTQREMSIARFRGGQRATPLPNPGVYALGNAVDLPGMLPDGTPSPDSVNHTLRSRSVTGRVPTANGSTPEPAPKELT
ncbi:NADH-quinone oxidoreductase subunit J [Tsukamurella soli]|uniref:NADH-quinone oxidoreductase subunit J n=1 Tax=Tsukamurella soli TaxID=644556 RepID=A0ABP8JV14_9ACTN